VRKPDRLVYTWSWKHDPGPWELAGDTQVTIEFRDLGKETELALTHERFANARAREEHAEGWESCLDRLERVVN
jgi:uncharacterized protein YndB with AHSA1/START domain